MIYFGEHKLGGNVKRLLIGLALLLAASAASAGLITTLLLNATTTGAGTGVPYSTLGGSIPMPNRWFQATLNGASAVSATVVVEGSTDNTNWVQIATFSLAASPAASATQAVATVQTAPWIRGNVTAISGVGESVTLMSGQ
jgi:hypothetical protein